MTEGEGERHINRADVGVAGLLCGDGGGRGGGLGGRRLDLVECLGGRFEVVGGRWASFALLEHVLNENKEGMERLSMAQRA